MRDFFALWGGEALYNHHEDDPQLGPRLRETGTPVIIEANVPIASLASPTLLAETFVHHYARGEGCDVPEACLGHAAHLTVTAPASELRLFVLGEERFADLTGEVVWSRRLIA